MLGLGLPYSAARRGGSRYGKRGEFVLRRRDRRVFGAELYLYSPSFTPERLNDYSSNDPKVGGGGGCNFFA